MGEATAAGSGAAEVPKQKDRGSMGAAVRDDV